MAGVKRDQAECMSIAGPTRGATERCDRWEGRQGAALALRVAMLVFPIAVSLAITALAGRTVPRPVDLGPAIVWWLTITAVATLTLTVTNRMMRRFLPIVAMLRLSLVFPDQAPSRFKMALRTGTVRQLEKKASGGALGSDVRTSAETLLVLAATLGDHDRLTRGHSERVRAYTNMIAQEMKLGADEQDLLHWSALLHDIGKLEVPPEILNKKGRPDAAEWEILRGHPGAAAHHLEPLADWLGEWRRAATEHHERWDGDGYPAGLRGEQISLAGRIVAVADAYDTITSVRSYKKAMSAADARAEIARCAGTQFDPAVVRAFLAVSVGDLRRVMGPVSWLAQLPILATAPTAAVPAVSNAVISSMAAGTVAVATVAGGLAAPVQAPVDYLGVATVSEDVADMPGDLAFMVDDEPAPIGADGGNRADTADAAWLDVEPSTPDPAARPEPTPKPTPTPATTPTPEPPSFTIAFPTPTPVPTVVEGDPIGADRPPAEPTPTAPPASTPTPRPTRTPTPTATPTPTPAPAAPAPPLAPGHQRHYFTAGDQLQSSMPTAQVLPDYDTDGQPGLLLTRGPSGFHPAGTVRLWSQTVGGGRFAGSPSTRIHVAPAGGDWSKPISITARLERCKPDLDDCETLATKTASPTGLGGAFAPVDIGFGALESDARGKPRIVVRISVGPGSQDDVVLAYGTVAYAGYLDIPD